MQNMIKTETRTSQAANTNKRTVQTAKKQANKLKKLKSITAACHYIESVILTRLQA